MKTLTTRLLPLLLLGAAACGDNQDVDQAADVTHAPAVETTVNEDGSVVVTIPMTGDAMAFAVSSKPSHGTVTGAGPQFMYHPGSDFSGKDSFRVTATETATKKQTIVPVFIGIGAVNDPPAAHDDQFTTAEDTELVIPTSALMANDTDVDSKLTVVAVTQPEMPTICADSFGCNHTAVILDGDHVTYHPYYNFNGTQTFTYTVSDGEYESTATASVRVTAVNDAPYAFGLPVWTTDDATYEISLGALSAYAFDSDGDTLFVTGVSNPLHGTLTVVDDLVRFVPDKVSASGMAGFDYTVSDGQLTSTGHVDVLVTHVNHAPIAKDDYLSVDQDTALPIAPGDVFGNDSDPDGDTFTLVSYTQPPHGFFYGSLANAYYVPTPGYVGDDSFEYTISDGLLTSTAVVHVEVKHVNHAPVANADVMSGYQDEPASITLSATDPDSDELTYEVTAGPMHGQVVLSGSTATYTPAAGYSGEDEFSFTASDGSLSSLPVMVSISVKPAGNQPPVPTSPEDSVYLGASCGIADWDFTLTATDPDSSTLTYEIVQVTRDTYGSIDAGTASVTKNQDGSFHYHRNAGSCSGSSWGVKDHVQWKVTDDHDNSATGLLDFDSHNSGL